MTISTRPDWRGNDAVHTFDDVNTALEYMKNNPCYEIIPNNEHIRPFGDIDFKVDQNMSQEEFNKIDFEVFNVIANLFKDHTITQFSASSYPYRKISHRWVIPDRYVKSIAHAKIFAADVYSRVTFPEGVSGDMSVYSNLRKMRTFWTSKPNEDRPFFMLQGQEEDHIISFVPSWATVIDFEIENEKQAEYKPNTEYEVSYLTQLCDCISIKSWTDYTSCQSLIFSLLSAGASAELIHRYTSKAKNYSFKWVNEYVRRYNPSKNKHSIGTVKLFAKQDNPEQYQLLKRDRVYSAQLGKTMFEEMTRLTEDENTKKNWCDENGFLKQFPLAKTVAVKSQMGTGKTFRLKEACTASPFNGGVSKVLVVSARQTFTTHICAELKTFTDYRSIKGDTIKEDKAVVQLQSLWKCGEMEPRDLLMLDEVESILASLSPNRTHKHYVETIGVFEKLVRTSKRVIAMDAFLTDRTMEMLRTLRGDVELIINPTQPYKRTATLVNEKELYGNIQKKLGEGKRLIAVWGAKAKGKSFHSILPSSVKQVLYTGDSDAKIKETHLADVDKYWAEQQLVGYTATITVGINYNGPKFDEACLYATPWSCSSRDYIQCLHRARKLNNNHITAYISPDPRPCSLEAGINEQEKQFTSQTERVKKFLHDIGHNPVDYNTLPQWLHRVIMWNTNEVITNYSYFPECMKGYFRACGISYGEDAIEEKIKDKTKSVHIAVEDVETICYEVAELYSRNRQTLTTTQQYELEKFYMIQKVDKVDDFIWTAWLDNNKQVERSWSIMNLSPEELIRDKIIDLVPKDAERLKIFQDLKLDWDVTWTIPIDSVPKVDLTLFGQRLRSNKETTEQYCRDLTKALKQWCGVETKVVSKRVREGKVRDYEYSLKYEPQGQLFSYMNRKITAAELFGNES